MSVKVSPGGLSGLVMKISDELKEKSLDEILPKYPISKTVLPYLLTLQEEYSLMFLDFVRDEYSPLEEENNRLKERIKLLEQKKGSSECEDTYELINSLKSRVKELEEEVSYLESKNSELEEKLFHFSSFFEQSPFCNFLLKRFSRG